MKYTEIIVILHINVHFWYSTNDTQTLFWWGSHCWKAYETLQLISAEWLCHDWELFILMTTSQTICHQSLSFSLKPPGRSIRPVFGCNGLRASLAVVCIRFSPLLLAGKRLIMVSLRFPANMVVSFCSSHSLITPRFPERICRLLLHDEAFGKH